MVVVRLFPSTHPVTGQTGFEVGEVGQLTVIVPGGIVEVDLQRALQLQQSYRDTGTLDSETQ